MAKRVSKQTPKVAPFSEDGLQNILEGLKPSRELVLPPQAMREILGVQPASELAACEVEVVKSEIALGLAGFWKETVRVSLRQGAVKPRLWAEAF